VHGGSYVLRYILDVGKSMQYNMTLAEKIVKAWGACEVICVKGCGTREYRKVAKGTVDLENLRLEEELTSNSGRMQLTGTGPLLWLNRLVKRPWWRTPAEKGPYPYGLWICVARLWMYKGCMKGSLVCNGGACTTRVI
jgi:hypothetical protein